MMRYLLSLLLLIVPCCSDAQGYLSPQYLNYINQYKSIAIEQMKKHGIPASITLAQGLLESRAGQSDLATKGNNHFGIKCHEWTGATVYHDDDERHECFRAYRSARESYEVHSMFLVKKQRYRRLFDLKPTDYKGWARGLKACGYATNPRYAEQLISIIERYQLHQYDSQSSRHHTQGFSLPQPADEHRIYIYNKNLYVIARDGDTWLSLSKELGIGKRKLARYNERNHKEPLHQGDIIYLKHKRTKADKAFKHRPHTVVAGESLYDIAQKYGITLRALYKKNQLTPDSNISVGQQLRVY